MHSLGGTNSVVSNSNMNMEDDMDNGTEKVHIKNHDQCDSCGDGGGLLCCDNCPRSFHFDCINPPIRPEAVEQMQGNWYCNDCKSKLFPKSSQSSSGTILGQLIDQLDATNPQTYQLPAEIKNSAGLKDRMDASSSDDMDRRDLDGEERPRKRVSKYKRDENCVQCGLGGDVITCFSCHRSFHSYCLDPVLLTKPTQPWQCPKHQNTHLIPDQVIKLDFTNENDKGNNGQNMNGAVEQHSDELEQAKWLLDLTNARSSNANQPKTLQQLLDEQLNLVKLAMPSSMNTSAAPFGAASVTPLVLSQLTPLFTQFLAWQRLMQINAQLAAIQSSEQSQQTTTTTTRLIQPTTPAAPSISDLIQQYRKQTTATTPSSSTPTTTTPPVTSPSIPSSTTPPLSSSTSSLNATASSTSTTVTNQPQAEMQSFSLQLTPAANATAATTPATASATTTTSAKTTTSANAATSVTATTTPAAFMSSLTSVESPAGGSFKRKHPDSTSRRAFGMPMRPIDNNNNSSPTSSRNDKRDQLGQIEDADTGKIVIPLKEESIMIGRKKNKNNPIDVDLAAIYPENRIKTASRIHAQILYDKNTHTFTLMNFGRNGTRVNNHLYDKNKSCVLDPNATITIGKVNLRLKLLN